MQLTFSLEGLERLGADVDSDIPDRISDGYGLNRHLVERAYEAGVDTLITCDNGIAAADEIAYGKEMGMTVIVTDHHEVPFDEQDGENDTEFRRQMRLWILSSRIVSIHLKDSAVLRLHTS